jgi:ankyrin repeat protein
VGIEEMSDLENLIDAVKRDSVGEAKDMLLRNPELANMKDETGATALHHATFGGFRELVDILLEFGADINAADSTYGATPTGWAIEYLRERGGFLAVELSDLAYAIGNGEVEWVQRFLIRYPGLKKAKNKDGVPFKVLAEKTGNAEIIRLFDDH